MKFKSQNWSAFLHALKFCKIAPHYIALNFKMMWIRHQGRYEQNTESNPCLDSTHPTAREHILFNQLEGCMMAKKDGHKQKWREDYHCIAECTHIWLRGYVLSPDNNDNFFRKWQKQSFHKTKGVMFLGWCECNWSNLQLGKQRWYVASYADIFCKLVCNT